jgi:predicted ThiF/HesA family dinucleotide-utilizing enzyme
VLVEGVVVNESGASLFQNKVDFSRKENKTRFILKILLITEYYKSDNLSILNEDY